VPQYGALEALPLAQLRSKLASWTMAAPSAPGNRLTVASIEPIALRDQPFSPIRGAVLKLNPAGAASPVRALKIRSTPTKPHDRAYVVGCAPAGAGAGCKQTVYHAELHARMVYSQAGGLVPLKFDEEVDWHDLIGSPVIDEEGRVIGVISGPYTTSAELQGPGRASAEEIPFLLDKPK
ncbi:MAG: hypothetical protein ACXW19_00980, partial [Thermoanaerobaculia bacterium]